MPIRLALGCALAGFACGGEIPPAAPDPDATALDAGGGDAADADAAVPADAGADSIPPDLTAPSLVAVIPAVGEQAWLHEPIQFELDEPITISGATVAAAIDGEPVAATLALEGDRTIVVSIAATARGVGVLELELGGAIHDLAGNPAAPIATQHTLAAWSRPPIDRGPAVGSPALAVGLDGSVVAAWPIESGGGRRVVVSRQRGAWESLGGTLGASNVASVAVAIDALDRPVVAWIEGTTAHVARWDGTTWSALASPGTGTQLRIATPPAGGPPTVAVFGADVAVRTLSATDTWQVLGDVAIAGLAGEAALAVPAAGRAVIGWVDAAGALRVYRRTTSWTALAPLAVAVSSRMSLAARGDAIAIAWDQPSGSSSVYAAVASGTGWTRLGRTLDVDVAGDATSPAVAIDGSGRPIVAWRELVETAERGVIARWSGAAWTIVGGPTWLASTPVTPARPTLALDAGGAPVVGWRASAAIGIARFNGPRIAGPGMTRGSIAGCSFSPAAPAPRALATGCFTLAAPGRPVAHAGLVPYDIVTELWSDGTKKRRWVGLPDGMSLTTAANGSLAAPVGTIVIKEFAIETTPGAPATRRAVETRFLVNTQAGWQGFSYRWRANGSDADLQTDGQATFDWPLAGGGTYRHLYPSRSQCLSCHHAAYGPLLGLRAPQLARWFDYDGTIADQLPTLASLAVAPASSSPPWIAAHDASATWEQRARAYMAANCAHCHNPNHIAIKDLRYPTPLAQTRLCEAITPGAPLQSDLYQRVTSRPGMPALGTLIVDPHADELLASWISGMTSCP